MPPPLVHPPPGYPVARSAPPILILHSPPGFPALHNHPPTPTRPPAIFKEDSPIGTATPTTPTPTDLSGVDPAFDLRVTEDQSPSSHPISNCTPSIAAHVPSVVQPPAQPVTNEQATVNRI